MGILPKERKKLLPLRWERIKNMNTIIGKYGCGREKCGSFNILPEGSAKVIN